jgi:hemolysin III
MTRLRGNFGPRRERKGVQISEASAKLPVNPWPHGIAFVLAAGGLIYFIVRFHADAAALSVMCVYGCGMLALFGTSALYHALGGRRPVLTPVLKRIDHASIYVMMAASYTPVLFFGLAGRWRSVTIAVVWIAAAAGAVVSIGFPYAPRAVSTALYAAFGWAALIPALELAQHLPRTATILIAVGGVLYTLGALVYATKTLNFAPGRFGFHEVFHCLVVAGAAVQFVAIAFFIAPAA